jgi:dTDP-4-dehydrorhamnose reductase
MNILVTGSNGQLGKHIQLCSAKSRHTYFYTDIDQLDITNLSAVQLFIRNHNINTVVNCAAYTNVDKAESEEPAADLLNHIAVRYLSEAMAAVNGLLIHFSTDYVFGGNKNNTP